MRFNIIAVWGVDLQTTVSKPIFFEGIGLHKGLRSKLVVLPAEAGSGICFKRTDIQSGNKLIPAILENVVNSELCTRLANLDGVSVSTIEHLMCALFGEGIDNALIEIDSQEVPILDGSAKVFIEKIISAGIEISDSPIKIIKINKEVKFSDGERFILIKPSTLRCYSIF